MDGYLGMNLFFVGLEQETLSASLINAQQNSVTGKLN